MDNNQEMQDKIAKLQEAIDAIREEAAKKAEEAARAKESDQNVRAFASLKDELSYIQQGLMEIMKKIVSEKDTALAASMSASRFAGQSYRINTTFFTSIDDIDETALSEALEPFTNPRRVMLLKALFVRELTPGEITQKTGLVGGQLYHHLTGLEAAGLIEKHADRYQVTATAQSVLISLIAALGERNIVNYEHSESVSREDTEREDTLRNTDEGKYEHIGQHMEHAPRHQDQRAEHAPGHQDQQYQHAPKHQDQRDNQEPKGSDRMKDTQDIMREIKDGLRSGTKDFMREFAKLQKELNIDLSALKHIDLSGLKNINMDDLKGFGQDVGRKTREMARDMQNLARDIHMKGTGFSFATDKPPRHDGGNFYQDDRQYNIHKKTYASQYSNFYDTQLEEAIDGMNTVSHINNGSYLIFKQMDFDAIINTFTARASSNTAGGRIEIRVDDTDGMLLGICEINSTGGWMEYADFSCPVKNVAGKRDLFLMFRGDGEGLFNLLSFKFSNQKNDQNPQNESQDPQHTNQDPDTTPNADAENDEDSLRIETGVFASDCDKLKQGELIDSGTGRSVVRFTANQGSLKYKHLHLESRLDTFQLVASSTGEATIEIRLDDPDGQLLGACRLSPTQSMDDYKQFECPIGKAEGEHTLYLILKGEPCANLHSFRMISHSGSRTFRYARPVVRFGGVELKFE